MQLEGVTTALVTPFQGQELDLEGLKQNICFQIENGVCALLIGGSTGEAPSLDLDEYEVLVKTAAETIEKRVPLIVNIGESATKRAIIKMQMATKLGADALLAVTPAYSKPSQEGLYQHFKALAGSSSLPLILYNQPGRTGVSLEIETLLRLVEIETIVAIKDASGSIQFVEDMFYRLPETFTVISGDDYLTLPLIALGAKGVFSVLSNLMPKQMVAFVESALAGDFEKARGWQKILQPFFNACSLETNPVPIKTMMSFAGMAAGSCRLPLASLKNENIEKIQNLLKVSEEVLALSYE